MSFKYMTVILALAFVVGCGKKADKKAAEGADKSNTATGDKATGDKATGDKATGDKATGDKATGDEATKDVEPAVPNGLPTDGKGQTFDGDLPAGCIAGGKLEVSTKGKALDFKVRSAVAHSAWGQPWELHVVKIHIANYDLNPENLDEKPVLLQQKLYFAVEGRSPKTQGDKVSWGMAPVTVGTIHKYANQAGPVAQTLYVRDSKGEDFAQGADSTVKVTHVSDKWICGELNYAYNGAGHDTKVSGTFVARTTKK